MFTQLIASRVVRRRSLSGIASSVSLHTIIIAGAVVVTSHPQVRSAVARQDLIRLIAPAPAPRAPAAVRPIVSRVPRIGIINVPLTVPDVIPPFNPLRTVINTDDPFVFRVGVPSSAGDPGAVPPDAQTIFTEQTVEVPVTMDARSPVPRYPQMLRDSGVEGVVRLRFVVDTLGRAEPATAEVVETTHQAFALSALATLPHMRFIPARVGDRRVRQLVEIPVQFRLHR